MKKLIVIAMIAAAAVSCGEANTKSGTPVPGADSKTTSGGNPSYDPNRGEGRFTKVDVSPTLNAAMAESGSKTFGVKCGSCHKLTEEKLVGPGWKGVTTRNTAEWIMNFITNPDVMLNKDPKAQAQLEICLVRMPNQNLADEEARSLYEFMRKNDGVK